MAKCAPTSLSLRQRQFVDGCAFSCGAGSTYTSKRKVRWPSVNHSVMCSPRARHVSPRPGSLGSPRSIASTVVTSGEPANHSSIDASHSCSDGAGNRSLAGDQLKNSEVVRYDEAERQSPMYAFRSHARPKRRRVRWMIDDLAQVVGEHRRVAIVH